MNYTYTDELYHFGIQGMKWGVRRYQNEDGSLTPAGRVRYGVSSFREKRQNYNNYLNRHKRTKKNGKKYYSHKDDVHFRDSSNTKKALRAGVAAMTFGTGRWATRFAANHKRGFTIASGIIGGVEAGLMVAAGGPGAIPSAAVHLGKTVALQVLAGELNDIMYNELYMKK